MTDEVTRLSHVRLERAIAKKDRPAIFQAAAIVMLEDAEKAPLFEPGEEPTKRRPKAKPT